MLIVLLLAIAVGIWYVVSNQHEHSPASQISKYEDLLKDAASDVFVRQESVTLLPASVSLTTMLESGVNTNSGLLQSVAIADGTVSRYRLMMQGKPVGIEAVSEIELVKAFLIESQQVILVGYDQGGNSCARQYQFVTMLNGKVTNSKPFGTCLLVNNIIESENIILVSMPQNDPYLGADVNYVYKYKNGDVKLFSKPSKQQIRAKYVNLTAAQIIKQATSDGCYQDGVLLEDGACGGGKRYCSMFKSIRKAVRDSNYQILKDFCS